MICLSSGAFRGETRRYPGRLQQGPPRGLGVIQLLRARVTMKAASRTARAQHDPTRTAGS